MANVVVFHHVMGLTDAVEQMAEQFRSGGHNVVVPDLFAGKRFSSIEDGVGYVDDLGLQTVIDTGVAAVADVDGPLAVVGFSLGVLPAQKLAQTDARVRAAALCFSAVPPDMFAESWPENVSLQIHLVENDPWAEEDRPAAEELAAQAGTATTVYPGSGHLVIEPSLADYDPDVTGAITEQIVAFIGAAGR